MRVLTVGNRPPDPSAGGLEVVWADLVAGLRSRGHDVGLLHPPELPTYWQEGRWRRPGPLGAYRMDHAGRRVLRGRLRAGTDVVVWISLGGPPLSLLREATDAGVAQVGLLHDGWLVYGQRHDRWHRLTRRRLSVPDALWCANSASTSDFLVRELALRRVEVATPGVDLERFAPAPTADTWEGRLVYVGRLGAEKGVVHAVRALGALPEATLTVHGPGRSEEITALREAADEAGVGQRVRLAGPAARDEVRDAYAAADAVVFPVTWPEPWGLVPLEAMAVGRPVIATGTGGSSEYLRDGENALLVAPGDPAAIAAAVAPLEGDPGLRARLVAGGRETAGAHDQRAFVARQCRLIEDEARRVSDRGAAAGSS